MNTFWKNKNVFITGYEGFLGSHITRALLEYKAKIVGLDIHVQRKDTCLEKADFKRIKVIKGSVLNYKLVSGIIKKYNIEVIFHLAADAIVGRSLSNPTKTFSTNIRGTWNVLEASRHGNVKAIIIASSDKAYGPSRDLPYRESYSLAGCYPYDVSKSCADLLASAYYHTYKLPVCITRCGNIFGPGDFNFSRIIPDTVQSALNDRTLLIRSNGKFSRDYIYIKDIVAGYLTLGYKMCKDKLYGEAFNFSTGNPKSVLEISRIIYFILGKIPNFRILNSARHEIQHQYLCANKAKKLLGWKPKYSLKEALKETIFWYKEFLAK